MYHVYILKCSDETLYTGIALDLDKRLKEHAEGKGAKYMRARSPFELVYHEEKESQSEALKREHAIKQLTREEKIELIRNCS